MATLGTYIRSLRKGKGMTQASLAAMLHVTDKAVSKWERDLSYPDISLFPRLADILGVSISDLLREDDDEGAPERMAQFYQRSPDIRTPIHIIIGCADLAERYADQPEKWRRYLETIRISGRYLLEKCSTAFQNGAMKDMTAEDLEDYLHQHKETAELKVYDFRGKRVLIVEDIELNREIAQEIVRTTGAEPVLAEDGRVCVEMMQNAPAGTYDLILMDLSMPNMDGIEATQRIRNMEDTQKAGIPIIAMTANVNEADRNAAFGAGMDGFTEKPIHIGELYETMKRYL